MSYNFLPKPSSDSGINCKKDATKACSSTHTPPTSTPKSDKIPCPKCGVGTIIRGKTAYGCSHWKTGCPFRFPFDEIRRIAAGRPLTREFVIDVLNGRVG